MKKVKKESKIVSSEGTELKEWFVNMPGIHGFSWTTHSKLLVTVTHDFMEDL